MPKITYSFNANKSYINPKYDMPNKKQIEENIDNSIINIYIRIKKF